MQVKLMDILTVRKGIICHQINPYAMGAGLALLIKKKWPVHYKDFEDWKKYRQNTGLGDVVFSQPNEWSQLPGWDDLTIAGMCAQPRYGPRGQRWTDYEAFRRCLDRVYEFTQAYDGYTDVYIPWKIGCGLGGGDWRVIESLIEKHLPDAILCKLGG